MKKFKEFLVERTMTFELALKVFGMSADEIGNRLVLKKKYRDLAMQHHPDKGGDKKISQDVNDAYAVLSDASKKDGKAKDNLAAWKARNAEQLKIAEQIKQSLLSNFLPEIFINYFNELSGYQFFYEITKTHKQFPGFTVDFFTKDKKTIFNLKINADITDVIRGGLGSGDKYSYTIYTDAQGFHLNKKQKMSKTDWGWTRDHSFFRKPEKLFPKKKLKAIFSGATSKRKFMKRDMIQFLTKKLGAEYDYSDNHAMLSLGDGYTLIIYRSTFNRVPFWSANGVYLKKGKYGYGSREGGYMPTGGFPETEETAKMIEKIQKEIIKVNGDSKVKKTHKLWDFAYKAYRKAKGF